MRMGIRGASLAPPPLQLPAELPPKAAGGWIPGAPDGQEDGCVCHVHDPARKAPRAPGVRPIDVDQDVPAERSSRSPPGRLQPADCRTRSDPPDSSRLMETCVGSGTTRYFSGVWATPAGLQGRGKQRLSWAAAKRGRLHPPWGDVACPAKRPPGAHTSTLQTSTHLNPVQLPKSRLRPQVGADSANP